MRGRAARRAGSVVDDAPGQALHPRHDGAVPRHDVRCRLHESLRLVAGHRATAGHGSGSRPAGVEGRADANPTFAPARRCATIRATLDTKPARERTRTAHTRLIAQGACWSGSEFWWRFKERLRPRG